MHQERLFRSLHNAIAEDIRNNTREVRDFDMNTRPFVAEVGRQWDCLRARTVWPIYFPLGGLVLIIYFKTLNYNDYS